MYTTNENGAKTLATSGKNSLDYFANIGTYRNRNPKQVAADMAKAWKEDPMLALSILFYARMITRKTKGAFVSDKVQKGQGIKDEFIKGLQYLEANHPSVLEKNLWIVPLVGSWKDLWYDSAATGYNHYIMPEKVYELVRQSILTDEYNRALIAKYLPRIRSAKQIKNDRHKRMNKWALGLCSYLGWSQKHYRQFKADPAKIAHSWQRKMSAKNWDEIDFSKIPGRALFQMVNNTGRDGKTLLQRHGLETKYEAWLDTQPTAKFTGYVYELFLQTKQHKISAIKRKTLDKQFDGLLALAKADGVEGLKGNVWCALDTSSSMEMWAVGEKGVTAYDVCISLGIYFSSLNEGAFKDHVVMFDEKSKVLKLSGGFVEKAKQIRMASTAWGSTNFQSVVDEIVRVRKANPTIPISEFPETLLVVSDMQFDKAGKNTKTNYEVMMKKLSNVGLGNIKVIWWQVTGRSQKNIPSKSDDDGVTLISGFDPAIISLILGGEKEKVDEVTGKTRALTPYENMMKALDQEVLKQLKID